MPTTPQLMIAASILVSLAGCKSAESKASPPERDSASQKSAQSETCEAGYERRDEACVDIDECGGVATPCGPLPDAKCRNTAGSYECTCAAGYVGGGPGGFGCAPSLVQAAQGRFCIVNPNGDVGCIRVENLKARADTPPLYQALHGVVALSADVLGSECALLRDGGVQCWGPNNHGQAGDGTTERRSVPISVEGVREAVSIVVSSAGGCALNRNGTVSCWGSNEYGALGRGTSGGLGAAGTVEDLAEVAAVTRKGYRSCALLRSGRARCWGSNPLGSSPPEAASRPVDLPRVEKAVQIAYDRHMCALREDRTVWCWGTNTFGELGDGTQTTSPTPIKASIDDVAWLGVGTNETRVLRQGKVYRWGRDYLEHPGMDQAGYDAAEAEKTPLPVIVRNADNVRVIEEELRSVLIGDGSIGLTYDELFYRFDPAHL